MSIIVELHTLDDFNGLPELWSEMLRQTPNASFFQSFAWIQDYCRHFSRENSLKIILVGDRERVMGIVPLAVREIEGSGLRVLEFLGSSQHAGAGPLGPHPQMALSATAKYLRGQRADWDAVDLRVHDWNGERLRPFQRALQFSGWKLSTNIALQIATVRFDDIRSRRARSIRPLGTPRLRGKLDYERFRPLADSASTDTGWELVECCNQVLLQSEEVGRGTIGNSRDRLFFEDVHVDAIRSGNLDMGVLTLNGQPVAFHYGFHQDGVIDELATGFIGTVAARDALMSRMYEDSRTRADREYRFVHSPVATRGGLGMVQQSAVYSLQNNVAGTLRTGTLQSTRMQMQSSLGLRK